VFVAVDFPDVNFRLAGALKRLGVRGVYYVSPHRWAWRAGRIRAMRRIADRVLVIFPFEEQVYRDADVAVEFVGHPLVELAAVAEPRESFLRAVGLDPARPTVALLPGSRPNEVRSILPDLVGAAELIASRVPGAQFVVARAPRLADDLFTALPRSRPAIVVVDGKTDAVLAACDVVLTASGTATVQAALHDRPMVVVYRLSPLTYYLGKPFVKVDTYAMVNLIAGRRVVPELIQREFTAAAVADEAVPLLTDPVRAAQMREALALVRARLGGAGASHRAALAVLAVAAS
jgi:lipid-A-disaccharide synthase